MATLLRALLVEDSESDASLIVRQLTKAGYEVDSERVETSGQMRAALETREWDVVIADYQLPAFDAPAALAILKQTGLGLPFIAVSGHVGEEAAAALMRAGAHDFLTKQNLARLGPAVGRELGEAHLRRERLEVAERLRHSEARFRELVEAAPDGIAIQTEGTFRYLNAAALRLYGADRPEQLVGQSIWGRFPPELLPTILERVRQVTENRTSSPPMEQKQLRLDGATIEVEVSAAPFDYEGMPASVVFLRDIGERQRAQERLDASQVLLQSVAEGTTDPVYVKDRAGRYLLVNAALARVLGRPVEDVLGKTDAELLEPGDAARLMEKDRAVMALRATEMVEDEIATATGERRIYLSTKGPMFDIHGEITGVFGISRDITDIRRAEEENLLLEAQLNEAQKLESIGRLAGGIAHDFNNLLSVINGHAGLALQRLKAGDPLHHALSEVYKAGEQAAALTRQLLTFSRQRPIELCPVDCNELLAANRDMFRRLVGEDVELIVKPAASLACVMADPGQLVQVLMNLVVNARDAMPGGGVLTLETAEVEAPAATAAAHPEVAPGWYVLLTVTDTGTGIDAATQQRMFDPFFTTKPVGKGTGLGLSTAYGIVRQCGGYMRVESEPGRGARFTIYLPRAEGERVEPPVHSPEPDAARGVETVLVVEDQKAVLDLACEILTRGGYAVLEAAGGSQAVAVCESHSGPIHLVLTDMVMPGMSGPDLAGRIESLRPGTKVLFMSGYTGIAIADLGAHAAYIQKPFTPESLIRKVRETLDAPSAPLPILVADDSPPIRGIFAGILRDAGYSVVEAADGPQTRERLRAGGIGLALIDLHMPGQKGLEDIRRLRNEHPDVKIALMSAAFGSASAGDAQALGVDAVLGKPLHPGELLEVVRRLLAPQRSAGCSAVV